MSAPESHPKTISALLNAIAVVSQTQEREAAERPQGATHTPATAAELMSWALASGLESQERLERLAQSAKIALAEGEALRSRDPESAREALEAQGQKLKGLLEEVAEQAGAQREAWQMMNTVSQALESIARQSARDPASPAQVSPMLKAAFDEAASPRAAQNLRMILDACLGSSALNSTAESPAMANARAQASALLGAAGLSGSAPAAAPSPEPMEQERERLRAARQPQGQARHNSAEAAEAAAPKAASEPEQPTEQPTEPDAGASQARIPPGFEGLERLIQAGSALLNSSNPTVEAAKKVVIDAAAERLRKAASKPAGSERPGPEASAKGPGAAGGLGGSIESTLIDALARQMGSKLASEGVEKAAEKAREWLDQRAGELRQEAGGAGADLGGLIAGALQTLRSRKQGERGEGPGDKPKGPGA